MRKSVFAMVGVVGLCLGIVSCTKKEVAPKGPRVLNIATWSNYVSPELLADFEKRTGIKVAVSNYSSNEELLAKLQAGASGYDLIFPSDYMVYAMIQLKLIQAIDRAKLKNFGNVDSKFLKKSYDPESKFSVPYAWSSTGIAVNRDKFKGELKGWKQLFGTPELAGKFTLLDDVREVMAAALKAGGHSVNSKTPAELAQAKETLMAVRSKVKGFTSETLMPLVNGEVAAAHVFMSDAFQARAKTGGKIEYVIPEEGGTLCIDNLAIPSTAAHVAEAHELVDFLLEPASAVSTVKAVMVASVNKDAFALLPPEIQANKQMFPGADQLARLEMLEDLGEGLRDYDRIWTEVKAER